MKITSKSIEIGGRPLTLEVGRFAQQATAAVLARYGDTMVIATVVASARESNLDYFPLSVEYVERLYAGGRIKGSRWVKREGRPSDDAILRARLIDRSIRPLFDTNYHHDVQVIITVLSVDGQNEPDMLGIIATSAALAISPLPWDGPIAAVRIGYVPTENGHKGFFVNPGEKEMEFSEMDLVVSGSPDKTVMIESGANEISEENMFEGITFAQAEIKKIIKVINELKSEVGKDKIIVSPNENIEKIKNTIKKDYHKEIEKLVEDRISKEREGDEVSVLIDTIATAYPETFDKKDIEKAVDSVLKETIRKNILDKNKRPDGRSADEIRDIESEVGLLPRTHGSAMFRRGQTQVLTVATLGSPSLEQLIESPEGETAKRYIHHYSMPPYSVGETGRVGFPSRREVGHGALAERALLPVIPTQTNFPYTIRLVSEVMSSNGSTSMASTCGSTLALMDAGVPIKNPVSGISIGMVQMDVKIDGLTLKMIEETLAKAKTARKSILKKMLEVIPATRAHISQYAPKIKIISIPKEKIGEIIGPGGKIIRQIIAETGCEVNVNDDGQVTIAGTDPEKVEIAMKWISGIIKEVQPEEVYEGLVRRILPFGAFVEILPGREGMVHVSQMAADFVANPNDVVQIGQKVTVRVQEIDDQGRINLSMLFGEDAKKRPPQPRRDAGPPRRDRFPRKRRF
ncbi:MAG: Polyribonucleotide nucleotidyltransferase [Candidatus Gottesmanbacteria bacterium GW2011_GWA2_42_18]|uniref:Polyribonucleotide nucleotidyltransferase n=1 Tax=Candidatus Gottesmanbacteria bacterium GW2011_GWA2_42_18 TaxID=1618442 RepID=A0A0G0Z8N0_9BACT|nr:MAG: Polyribonucleotide nucleotidyltransferase [Candidatus Gottesmanbacteria bacterium GW2011_GWA2_42_18]